MLAIEPSCSFFVCFAPHIFEYNVAGIPCGPLVVPNSGHKDGHNKNNKTFDEVSVCFVCVLCVFCVCVCARACVYFCLCVCFMNACFVRALFAHALCFVCVLLAFFVVLFAVCAWCVLCVFCVRACT